MRELHVQNKTWFDTRDFSLCGCVHKVVMGSAAEATAAVARVAVATAAEATAKVGTSTALVVHTDPLLQRLIAYLEARGGHNAAALVAGWSTRVGVRTQTNGKTHDVYYFNEENVKFRSCKEVAQHFGLLEASVSLRIIGECPPEAVDKKLWRGAYKQGWSVFSTNDGHNRYTAPDGHKFHRKPDAEAWRPGGPPPAKKRRLQYASSRPSEPSTPLLTLASSAAVASAALASERGPTAASPLPITIAKPKQAAAPPPTAPSGMGPVRAALARIGLEQYAAALDELGYDDLSYLGICSEQRLRQVAAEACMKPGHASKFAAWLLTGPPAVAVGLDAM